MEKTTSTKTELELEAKSLLGRSKYTFLLSYFNLQPSQAKRQINYVFDTSDWSLNEKGIILRMRGKGEEYELTLKVKADRGGILERTHKPFLPEERRILFRDHEIPKDDSPESIHTALTRLGFTPPYFHHGDIITDRIEIPYKGCTIALDHNLYLGKEDYEIEAERVNEDVDEKQVLEKLLAELSIDYLPSLSKTNRFFEMKKEPMGVHRY